MVKLLLNRGANSAGQTRAGWGVLSNAVREGHNDITKVLLAAGADPEEVNKDGNTPLMLAAGNETVEITALLIKAGAAVDQSGPMARQP
jgi:ankyrin repeat protein